MFEPVRGLQFDRIVAHPPYMPSLKPAEVYYDGGPDGELITGTAIREVHQYLRPGGRLILQTLGTDRQSASFEQRIRGWLGSASDEFHLAIIARRLIEPSQFAASSALRDGGGMELAEQWKRFFRKSEIIRLVYGIVVLERRQGDGAAYSVHRLVGPQSRLAEAEWLMQWEAYAAHPRSRGELLELRPVTSPRAELRITHRPQDGELQPAGALLVTEAGGVISDVGGRPVVPFDLTRHPEEDIPFVAGAPEALPQREGVGQGLAEVLGELAAVVVLEPVVFIEARAQRERRLTDLTLLFVEIEFHGRALPDCAGRRVIMATIAAAL